MDALSDIVGGVVVDERVADAEIGSPVAEVSISIVGT
jgi:hypothetical protein